MEIKIKNRILLHSLVAKHSTLAMDIDIAGEIGFDGLEISQNKIWDYLDAGFSRDDLKALVQNISIPGIGFLVDIERQGSDKADLIASAAKIFGLAQTVGAKGVQVLTGPLNVEAVIRHTEGKVAGDVYPGLLGKPADEQVALTVRNLAELADLADRYGLVLYLEALAWTPLNTIAKQLAVIERAERNNIRIVIDYWHCYASGDTPDTLATIDKRLIYGVHICDSLKFEGGIPNEPLLRDVPTGRGVLDLQLWTDAVKATGYDDWWSCELFCKKQHQQNSYEVARELKALMDDLIG